MLPAEITMLRESTTPSEIATPNEIATPREITTLSEIATPSEIATLGILIFFCHRLIIESATAIFYLALFLDLA